MWDMERHEVGKISKHKTIESPGGQTEVCGHRRNVMEESKAISLTPFSMRSFQNECAHLHQL